YATLTLDQRDLGVTDPEADLELFMKGDEPLEHLMVHDALCAAEILRSIPGIDPDRILYAGESNGGRTAIIACALDEGSRGVLAISTCGYGVQAAVSSGILEDQQQIRFYRSIDPETYLGDLPPRMLVMLHSRNDTVIPYGRAIRTYSLARQPRALYAVGCARHGYCQEMDGYLEEALQEIAS
ncbi:MAG: alpha/beta hydrolase, partial [Methanothrix sp.]|nr:alpha/beta hydrolase [Methanothrix sp.]